MTNYDKIVGMCMHDLSEFIQVLCDDPPAWDIYLHARYCKRCQEKSCSRCCHIDNGIEEWLSAEA